jgi:hypothetical protein
MDEALQKFGGDFRADFDLAGVGELRAEDYQHMVEGFRKARLL